MEWPKRARTADWENGVLTLDGEKKFEIPELTMASWNDWLVTPWWASM